MSSFVKRKASRNTCAPAAETSAIVGLTGGGAGGAGGRGGGAGAGASGSGSGSGVPAASAPKRSRLATGHAPRAGSADGGGGGRGGGSSSGGVDAGAVPGGRSPPSGGAGPGRGGQPPMNSRSLSGALGSRDGVGGGVGRNGVSRVGGAGAVAPRRKLKIRPFARKPEVPTTFFPVTWETRLRPAVRAVQTATALEGFSLEELYGAVEDSVRHGHAAALYSHISVEVESHIDTVVSALDAAAAATADSASFLTDANRAWEAHCAQMSTIRAIFLVLDRGYVLSQPGTANVLPLWDLSLRHFRSALAARPSVAARISSGLLDVIRRERDGDSNDVTLVTSLASMLSAVGVYAKVFEGPFLSSTAQYFASESARLIDSMDLSAYLAHVEARLTAEAARVTSCLDATTRRPLVVTVERHLLATHVQALLDKGFATLANEVRVADLARLWLLYGRVDANGLPINVPFSSTPESVDDVGAAARGVTDGAMDRVVPGGVPGTMAALGPAQECIKAALGLYVRAAGAEIVNAVGKDANMVPALVALRTRVEGFVQSAFGGGEVVSRAVRDALEAVVNSRQNKTGELIAKYVDFVLRTGHKGRSDEEVDATLESVMSLFRLIHGKDIFEAFYKKDLAKRLVHGKSASLDLEKMMISKLKTECGANNKLEGMFRDIEVSRETVRSFRTHARSVASLGASDVDLSVFVLTNAYWPHVPQAPLRLPQTLSDLHNTFKDFYVGKHSRRKLTWQYSNASTTVRARFPTADKLLSLSLYQTVVLLLFNDADELSMEDISSATGLVDTDLHRTLLSLACGKVRVLHKRPKGSSVTKGDMFVWNKGFTHPQVRIKINAIQVKESAAEDQQTTERVFMERHFEIDAAIVRILKTRRTLTHTNLISELFAQLRFPFKVVDLKKRIESLIEREYLERDANAPQTYHYLA